jgi:hypothetical protein
MDNPELARRAVKAYAEAHDLLGRATGNVGLMRDALRRCAIMTRDNLGDAVGNAANRELGQNLLDTLPLCSDAQIVQLHQKWLDDTRRAAELFRGLVKDLYSKKWWQFWK